MSVFHTPQGASTLVDVQKMGISWTQDAGVNGGVDYYQRITPSEAGSVAWHEGKFEVANAYGPRHNQVLTMGWNLNPNGGAFVGGAETACGFGFETYYSPAVSPGPYMEQHLYFVTTSRGQRRPISWLMDRGNGDINGAIECERLTIYNLGGGLQTMVINPSQTAGSVVLGRFNQLPVMLLGEYNNTAFLVQRDSNNSNREIARVNASDQVEIAHDGGATKIVGTVGFNNATPISKPTITGSRGGNAALASLLTQLANYGLITDGTSA